MRVIDLSQSIAEDMPIWPGDPETKLEVVQTIDIDTWELRYLQMSTHSGTHVNVPAHMVVGGKTLDDYTPSAFMGKAVVIDLEEEYPSGVGLLFTQGTLDMKYVDKIISAQPLFIGTSENCEFDVETERKLLELGIISFENLTNLEQLPTDDTCMFYGFPLKIKAGDGSPVRAVAVIQTTQE
jgi:arylformamidase